MPSSPSVPVAQNVHPILHPTWEETHRVTRPPLSWRITTLSTLCPSCVSTTIFVVLPSFDVWQSAMVVVRSANLRGIWSRANWGMPGTRDFERSTASRPASASRTAACRMARQCFAAVSVPRFGPRPSSRNDMSADLSKREVRVSFLGGAIAAVDAVGRRGEVRRGAGVRSPPVPGSRARAPWCGVGVGWWGSLGHMEAAALNLYIFGKSQI